MSNALSNTGRRMLADNEAVIENGLAGFLAIGKALTIIRDQSLYREDYGDFETYLNGRWGMSKSRAYQLMQALELSTIVDDAGALPLANEGQLRALLPVKGDRKALVEIIGKANAEGDTSARNLSKYVASYTPPAKKTAEKQPPTSGSSDSDFTSETAPPDVDPDGNASPVPASPVANAAPIDTTAREEFAAKVEHDVFLSERDRLAGVIEAALSEFDCVGGKPWDEVALVAIDALIADGVVFSTLESFEAAS